MYHWNTRARKVNSTTIFSINTFMLRQLLCMNFWNCSMPKIPFYVLKFNAEWIEIHFDLYIGKTIERISMYKLFVFTLFINFYGNKYSLTGYFSKQRETRSPLALSVTWVAAVRLLQWTFMCIIIIVLMKSF